MKIAIITHKFGKGDGQGRVNYEIAREALRRGHQLTLIATEVSEDLRTHPAVAWVPIAVGPWPTALVQNQIFAWKSALWLRAYRRTVDIVQVNGFISWAASDINAVHFVHSAWQKSPVHTSRLRPGPYGLYQWAYTALNARLERCAFAGAGTVIAVSDRVRQELREIGVPEARIQVIVNGVDLDEFAPGYVHRDALGLPDVVTQNVTLALFAGDIRTPRKNLDTILRALVSVPDLHLMIAGSTVGSPYPALCAQLGLSGRVHFLGFRRDVAALMRAADLFVFPSRYEACSLVLLEALASGLPVITAVTAGGAEVVTPECGIVLADPEDIGALAAAMTALTHNAEHRQMMSAAARAAAKQHSWSRMADAYLNVWEAYLDGSQETGTDRSRVQKCVGEAKA